MLGSTKLTALLGSAPDATRTTPSLKAYTKTLQNDAGLALFLVVPGGNNPADCRTTQARNKAIKEAEAGEPKPTGLHMATHSATHLGRWIDKYRKDRDPDTPVNMALEVGRSRLVVIDVDTVAELDAFRQTWAERSGDPALAWVAPTVSSPASRTPTPGEWVHRGGGHFYLRLPEGLELPPETPSTLTYGEAGSQWVARIKDAYVLIPPSQRKEGTYWVSGTDHAIPDWLLADILGNARGSGPAEGRARREGPPRPRPPVTWMRSPHGPRPPHGTTSWRPPDGLPPDARTVARVTSGPGRGTTRPPSRPPLTTPGVPIPG